MSRPARELFDDDKKLEQLCQDFFHHREELKRKAQSDPSQTPTITKLASLIILDGEQLTIEELIELQHFCDNDYADYKLAKIQSEASGFMNPDGSPVNDYSQF